LLTVAAGAGIGDGRLRGHDGQHGSGASYDGDFFLGAPPVVADGPGFAVTGITNRAGKQALTGGEARRISLLGRA
jgi:hypothetical protein